MSITIDKYVDITSGVGAGAVATTRSLVGRLFTGNTLVPPGTFLTFSSAADVSSYFGSASEEAARAAFYFSWVSKNINTAQSIQFARWVDVNAAPRIYSAKNNNTSVSLWAAVSDGSFGLTIGAETHNFSSISFSSPSPVIDLSQVAAIVTDTIQETHSVFLDGDTTSSSATIAMTDTTGVAVGQKVIGDGIPANSFVTTVTANTSIVITNAATATATGTELKFYVSTPTVLAGDTTSSSPTIVMANTSGIAAGQYVTGTGIPANTRVLSVIANTSVTISNNATATNTGVSLTFYVTNLQWSDAVVTYNAVTGSFDFVGGNPDATDGTIEVLAGVGGTDISAIRYLGWIPEAVNDGQGNLLPVTGAIWSSGSLAQSITETLQASSDLSNNFGSFLFLTNLNLTEQEVTEAATWNASQNVLYMYTVGLSEAQASTWPADFASVGGVAFTLSPLANEYPEQIPMMIEAATDYTKENAVQNYMYQIFPGITPSVSTTAQSNSYDAVSVNYYGSTQTAGQIISFYQRGLLQGASNPTNITDMNAYVNEIWLKDAAAVEILNLLLGLGQVAANSQGRSQVLATLQTVIDQALLNGTISVGKTLSNAQRAFITNETGDENAWHQVQNAGYWVDCQIVPIPNVSPTQYEADYTLIYSKDDVIRKVVGTQTLI